MDTEIRCEIRREPIEHPSAWRAKDVAGEGSWIYPLDERDRTELRSALARVRAGGVRNEDLTAAAFPLPNLAPRLAQILFDINHGRGFVLIRGFPIEGYGEKPADVETMYWGLVEHFGKPLSQNAYGDVIGHVRDVRGFGSERGWSSRGPIGAATACVSTPIGPMRSGSSASRKRCRAG